MVTYITYIRTREGFAYLTVVINLYSRRVVNWSMQGRQTTDVVLQEHSMSRRGNCHDNVVAGRFCYLPKRERISRQTYKIREQARQDVIDYSGMFPNPTTMLAGIPFAFTF